MRRTNDDNTTWLEMSMEESLRLKAEQEKKRKLEEAKAFQDELLRKENERKEAKKRLEHERQQMEQLAFNLQEENARKQRQEREKEEEEVRWQLL